MRERYETGGELEIERIRSREDDEIRLQTEEIRLGSWVTGCSGVFF